MPGLLPRELPSFLASLPEADAERVRRAAIVMRLNDGEMVHSRGDMRTGLSIVRSGLVRVGVYDREGNFIMASLLGPGQCFGEFTLFTDLPRTHDISAVGITEILQLPGRRFLDLCDAHPVLLRTLLGTSLGRVHILLEMLDALRRLPLPVRVAKTLLILTLTAGSASGFPCRQADLASTLGMSRMSLNKALRVLVDRKLVELGYGEIRIPDRDALADWVDERDA